MSNVDGFDGHLSALLRQWRDEVDAEPFRHAEAVRSAWHDWACRTRYLAGVTEVLRAAGS